MTEKIPLVVIVGPTAVGKTETTIIVAKNLNGEIVSADSMQIYKYMDIGTAKPTIDEMQGVPHHMVSIIEPSEKFSVAQYQKYAKECIGKIYNNGKLPILTGGTGLYINSIIYPMDFTQATYDSDFRNAMIELIEKKGKEFVYNKLVKLDPETASKLHPNDTKRVIRALEVIHLTGKPMSQYKQRFDSMETPYSPIIFGLTMERHKLYERINKRVDIMIERGLIQEVESLLERGYSKESQAMQGLGYKEFFGYLEGKDTLENAVEMLKRDTRRYAKRQLTWFRRYKDIKWVNVDDFNSRNELGKWITLHIKKTYAL